MATKQEDQRDKAWAQRIASLMEAAGFKSPAELAKRMRINRSTAYHWCNGIRVPSRDMQPRLAKMLGVTVAELNGWAA
jgi:transcriptional regulator with XRE-family HTH domain